MSAVVTSAKSSHCLRPVSVLSGHMYVKPNFSTGYNLNFIQMGIFTELSILYSKYRPEKCMSPVWLVFLETMS